MYVFLFFFGMDFYKFSEITVPEVVGDKILNKSSPKENQITSWLNDF